MSKNLAKLLDQPERLVTRAVNKLEELNGFPSEDSRLLAENTQAVRQKIADLGLDPDDTTGEELYQALLAKYQSDSAMIDKALGISRDSSQSHRLEQASQLVLQLVQSDDVWTLKPASAKKLVREQPPKKLMKQLNYRSVESILKRENVSEIILAAQHIESDSWRKAFAKNVNRLKTTDYELRSPEVITLKSEHWSGIDNQPVITSDLVGAIALSPGIAELKAPVLTISLVLLGGLENLTHSEATGSIASINPALLWWDQAKTLVANCDDEVVSFNYKDISNDHLKKVPYEKRETAQVRASLWRTLSARYQNQETKFEESLQAAEAQTKTKVNKLAPKQLAVEYAEAIANEF